MDTFFYSIGVGLCAGLGLVAVSALIVIAACRVIIVTRKAVMVHAQWKRVASELHQRGLLKGVDKE